VKGRGRGARLRVAIARGHDRLDQDRGPLHKAPFACRLADEGLRLGTLVAAGRDGQDLDVAAGQVFRMSQHNQRGDEGGILQRFKKNKT
jgi:hypothetical protein